MRKHGKIANKSRNHCEKKLRIASSAVPLSEPVRRTQRSMARHQPHEKLFGLPRGPPPSTRRHTQQWYGPLLRPSHVVAKVGLPPPCSPRSREPPFATLQTKPRGKRKSNPRLLPDPGKTLDLGKVDVPGMFRDLPGCSRRRAGQGPYFLTLNQIQGSNFPTLNRVP